MRKLLFKGKRIDNGQWIIGENIQHKYKNGRKEIYLADSVNYWSEVIPETVSQWIGINDKNNKAIFENDIIKDSETGEIFKIFYNWDRFSKTNNSHYFLDLSLRIYECEVIGNIYDNPELLK